MFLFQLEYLYNLNNAKLLLNYENIKKKLNIFLFKCLLQK